MKMFFITDDSPPGSGVQRKRESAVIPPFTFIGELEKGESGIWSPPRTMALISGTITATWPGPEVASFTLFRIEIADQRTALAWGSLGPYNENPFGIDGDDKRLAMRRQTRSSFKINKVLNVDSPVISPFEGLMVKSYNDSLHENVVIQLVGEYVDG
jgi:hypothetical protein